MIAQGTYKIIRVDGTETVEAEKPSISKIMKAIKCECLDSVTLGNDIVMLVDDTGMIDGKPVNKAATALMLKRFGPKYPNKIHGDVVIINDLDFE